MKEKRQDEQNSGTRPPGVSAILSPLVRPGPSEIGYKSMRFLIMDRPTDDTLNTFIQELQKRNVKDVVRVCEPTYKIDQLTVGGITVHDWQFDDGSPPPPQVVENWFNLLRNRFRDEADCCVAVHCVAGLGRQVLAPVLVALALIELGMKYEDAVELIRQKRRGAINAKQLSYLASYRPKSRLKFKSQQNKCCVQ